MHYFFRNLQDQEALAIAHRQCHKIHCRTLQLHRIIRLLHHPMCLHRQIIYRHPQATVQLPQHIHRPAHQTIHHHLHDTHHPTTGK